MKTEYYVLAEDNSIDLSAAVNTWIADGWEPLGGISVAGFEHENFFHKIFAQAMVRLANAQEKEEKK